LEKDVRQQSAPRGAFFTGRIDGPEEMKMDSIIVEINTASNDSFILTAELAAQILSGVTPDENGLYPVTVTTPNGAVGWLLGEVSLNYATSLAEGEGVEIQLVELQAEPEAEEVVPAKSKAKKKKKAHPGATPEVATDGTGTDQPQSEPKDEAELEKDEGDEFTPITPLDPKSRRVLQDAREGVTDGFVGAGNFRGSKAAAAHLTALAGVVDGQNAINIGSDGVTPLGKLLCPSSNAPFDFYFQMPDGSTASQEFACPMGFALFTVTGQARFKGIWGEHAMRAWTEFLMANGPVQIAKLRQSACEGLFWRVASYAGKYAGELVDAFERGADRKEIKAWYQVKDTSGQVVRKTPEWFPWYIRAVAQTAHYWKARLGGENRPVPDFSRALEAAAIIAHRPNRPRQQRLS
jgi:hypothetical protein